MQNTDAAERDNDTKLHDQPATPISNAHDASDVANLSSDAPPNGTHDTAQNGCDARHGEGDGGGDVSLPEPPSKKRKIYDSDRPSRAPSPPWKRIEAEGPTSFVIDGRRKSGRTNNLPPPLTPGTDKRRTRGAGPATKGSAKGAAGRNGHHTPASAPAAKASRSASAAKANGATFTKSPPIYKQTRTYNRRTTDTSLTHTQNTPATNGTSRKARPEPSTMDNSTRRRSGRAAEANNAQNTPNGHDESLSRPNSPTSNRTPRLTLRFGPMTLPILHPGNVVPQPKYSSFSEFLQHDDPFAGEEYQPITAEAAKKEALLRLRILEAAQPGGVLSEESCHYYADYPEEEPPPQFGPWDHIASHACHFKKLLQREKNEHVQMAKKVAREAVDELKRRQDAKLAKAPVTKEELEAQQAEYAQKRYRQLVKDVENTWLNVRAEVDQRRLVRWQEQEHALGKKALDEMLGKSESLLKGMRDRVAFGEDDDGTEDLDSMDDDEDSESRFDSVRPGSSVVEGQPDTGAGSETSPENASDVMSSDEDEDEGPVVDDDDANLTQDQLREKYAHLQQDDLDADAGSESEEAGEDEEEEEADESSPGLTVLMPNGHVDEEEAVVDEATSDRDGPQTNGTGDDTGNPPQLEEVDDILMDDEDSDMDSGSPTESDEDEDDEDDDDDNDDHDEDQDEPSDLFGFYSKSSVAGLQQNGVRHSTEEPDDEVVEEVAVEEEREAEANESTHENGISAEPGTPVHNGEITASNLDREPATTNSIEGLARPTSPPAETTVTEAMEDVLPTASEAATPQQSVVSRGSSSGPSGRYHVPPPSLLRGTLRPYQQEGLNWLAGLNISGTNGILADEMGLGKTIQTIALLAHLAVDRGVWGPHLVVVPTSVVLNWEMEFKKFCPGFKVLPYMGTMEERKRKRKGWGRDDTWNVVITSYQLILQDAAAFKKRAWHYLILDEAHNIKNFQTQRWQTLLNFRTERRLLLTGTPLQNNLQELWSLLFFLVPAGDDGKGGFADLANFNNAMSNPSKQILEQGRQELDPEAQKTVRHLHTVLRPYLLRRLKSEVEKQMPGKYEHVVYCRLSKRQRQLYDEFMGRTDTRATLSGGNYMSIMNCLMSLRKVCNHPDLFETRQINTSWAFDFGKERSSIARYEIKDFFVRKQFLQAEDEKVNLDHLNLLLVNQQNSSRKAGERVKALQAVRPLEDLIERQTRRIKPVPLNGSSQASLRDYLEDQANRSLLSHFQQCLDMTRTRTARTPIYGTDTVRRVTIPTVGKQLASRGPFKGFKSQNYLEWYSETPSIWSEIVPTLEERALSLEDTISRFSCTTTAVVSSDILPLAISDESKQVIRASTYPFKRDPFHESRVRLSIAFPDKRLLQWDCGKLQRLALLLRDLQAGGHRALIFTQMTKVLDILEQFLNIHGHRYLRLDGSTKIEQRQMLTERFNKDPRILAFILSSRSGGLGINLTGADTVIFYDLDWNPAMDAQCQDRCHRIGQTRDVHIYRFVSEYTIEANILRKSNQKRLLDDVIIQKGDFTTDYFNRLTYKDALDDNDAALEPDDAEANAAVEKVLGSMGKKDALRALDTVEDTEDVVAARETMKEVVTEVHADEADFNDDKRSGDGSVPPPEKDRVHERAAAGVNTDGPKPHVDETMLALVEWELRDVPLAPPKRRRRDRRGAEAGRGRRKR